MLKRNLIALVGILLIFTALLLMYVISNNQSIQTTPPSYITTSLFSNEADQLFVSTVARSADLNVGITLERVTSMSPDQDNNITFGVFNHTNEPVVFPNQGFGIAVFRFDNTNKLWENLQLQYRPYSESKTLPPNLESWDFEINNSWDISEDQVMSWGYKQIRVYVSGKGKVTNTAYGAYLDVAISTSP
jgi:hypothetical protein